MSELDSTDTVFVDYLRTVRGALVILPSDTSPVAELVRAAVRWADSPCDGKRLADASEDVLYTAGRVTRDPAVRAWFERGRHG